MAVQGNVPRPGLDFNAERRQVLDNHVDRHRGRRRRGRRGDAPQARPRRLARERLRHRPHPQRRRPGRDHSGRSTRSAPPSSSAPCSSSRPRTSPTSRCSTSPGKGITETYVKQHPVPFAEYIPNRDFFRRFSDKVDLVRADFAAGTGPVLFRVPAAAGGEVVAGPTICFEVAYDDLVRANVDLGANLLLVQTNNATFGYTDESVQQLAISRIRAMEHGRSVVHVSTVGVSALITPDGTVHQPSALFTRTVLSGQLPAAERPDGRDDGGSLAGVCGRSRVRGRPPGRAAPDRPTEPATRIPADSAARRERTAPRMTAPMHRAAAPPTSGAGRRAHPDLQRAREPAAHRRAGARPRCRPSTSWCSTTTRPTAPARSPTSSPAPTPRSTSCTGRASRGSARPTSPGSPGPSTGATTPPSRWTRTARTSPSSCPPCSTPRSTPTSSSARGGSAAARVVNWPMSRTGPQRRRQRLRPGHARHVGPRRDRGLPRLPRVGAARRWTSHSVESQGYWFQVDMTWRAVQGRADRRRGADRVRRARHRRVQDERAHRPGGHAQRHEVVGDASGGPPARSGPVGPVPA